MEIRLSTAEVKTLTTIRDDSRKNQYRKDGWGVVVSYDQKKFPKSHLKNLNDAGLIEVCTVHRSRWKNGAQRWGADSYEVLLTQFGFDQLALHERRR